MSLPSDILVYKIFPLDEQNLKFCFRVCKSWKQAVQKYLSIHPHAIFTAGLICFENAYLSDQYKNRLCQAVKDEINKNIVNKITSHIKTNVTCNFVSLANSFRIVIDVFIAGCNGNACGEWSIPFCGDIPHMDRKFMGCGKFRECPDLASDLFDSMIKDVTLKFSRYKNIDYS